MDPLSNRRKHRSKQKPAVGGLLCLELLLLLAAVSCQEYRDSASQAHPEDLLGQPAALRSSQQDIRVPDQPIEALQQPANTHWSIRLAGDAEPLPKWCKKATEPVTVSQNMAPLTIGLYLVSPLGYGSKLLDPKGSAVLSAYLQGSWHLLSDDEYTESAYAACAGVSAPTDISATRPNTRRIRKAKARSGKGRRLGAGTFSHPLSCASLPFRTIRIVISEQHLLGRWEVIKVHAIWECRGTSSQYLDQHYHSWTL